MRVAGAEGQSLYSVSTRLSTFGTRRAPDGRPALGRCETMRRRIRATVRTLAATLCATWLPALVAPCARAANDVEPPAGGKLESVVVTGSNILRRIDGETALPIQVITRDDILRSGA